MLNFKGFSKKTFLESFPKWVQYCYWYYRDWRYPKKDRPFGIIIFVGLGGSGKTLSLIEFIERQKRRFPRAIVATNFGYKNEDLPLRHWEDLLNIENGDDGVIFGLDEVHDVFNRNDWRDIDPRVLKLFSQHRKHAKQFLCTDQRFGDVVIDLRTRVDAVVQCDGKKTLSSTRWIFQKWYQRRDFSDEGKMLSVDPYRKYSFIASDYMFSLFSSFDVVQSIRESVRKRSKH
jgi:hypothetical protein